MEMLEELLTEYEMSKSFKNNDGTYNRLRKPTETVEVDTWGEAETKPISEINELLMRCLEDKASDLHIAVGAPPKYRVFGELRPIPGYSKITPQQSEACLKKILDDEQVKHFDLEGDLDLAYSIPKVGRFRVNLYKQRGTCAGVFRILNTVIPSTRDLNLPASVVKLIEKKRGLVLVTGPTGSGKSTTLASLINEINKRYRKNIITLEDPIEYTHKHDMCNISQREIGVDSKNFASALRASLREDPDVILVGEMRDFETISTAISAAETGHLVFSTLHTIGASATVDRIIDMYPAKQQGQARSQLSQVLEGVISQQLVPLASGKGRVAAFEVMTSTIAIRNLIREGKIEQIPATMQTSSKDGMQLLDDNLMKLVRDGAITSDTALEFAVNQKQVLDKLKTGGRY